MNRPETVLLLEGPLSPLYRLIGQHLSGAGVSVHRINLCPGDALAWRRPGAVNYRGRKSHWPEFVASYLDRHDVDAVLMHSERRPYHLEAAAAARARGADVLVTELGYLRPDWMTLERNGNSVDSLLPTDPNTIRRLGAAAPPVDTKTRFAREWLLETRDDLWNALPNVFGWFLYPHYRQHGLYHPFVAYGRFLAREAWRGGRDAAAKAVRETLKPPFFLFAMQTDTDFQIRANSQLADMEEALAVTMASFASHAPPDAKLVVKKHPGDLGPVNWKARVPTLARQAGVEGRVLFVDGLGMDAWCADAAGLITVNSSAGLDGLAGGVPTHTLSPSIYDVPGLVHQGTLDAFWTEGTVPDAELFNAYRRMLAAAVQVRGTIYSREGTKHAAREMAARILAGTVGEPGAVEGPPPRYERARRLGIR